MRKIIIIAALLLVTLTGSAQKYQVAKDGTITESTKKDTTKKADSVVQIMKDGTKIYKGSKGGLYYWKLSAKSGQLYKCYLKKAE